MIEAVKKTAIPLMMILTSCSSSSFMKTVDHIDLPRFMGDWYVLGGRFTYMEKEVYNSIERYTWNEKESRIDVDFTYRKGSFDGALKSIPQKAWIHNTDSNAHWKVSPFWPLKFDYLVLDLASDYSWTAIGVPSQKYLWIMARDWKSPAPIMSEAIERLKQKGYDTSNLVTVPHRWP
jgi:apolipoprotein D and lipocalin family protein